MTDCAEGAPQQDSSTRRRWYALLCIAAGAAEYALVLTAAGAALTALLSRLLPGHTPTATAVAAALTHVAAALWMRWRYDRPLRCTRAPAPATATAAAGTLAVIALDAAATLVLRALGHGAPASTATTTGAALARAVVAAVVGPLCEEYVFRRALLGEARRLARTRSAVPVLQQGALAGAAFGLLHVPAAVAAGEGAGGAAAHVLYAACFGAAATALDHAAGDRLWPGALAHAANNALALRSPVAPAHAAVATATLGQCAALALLAARVAHRAP